MKDPTYQHHRSAVFGINVEEKLGPDWNPRTLSSFSTFGGVVPNGFQNGQYPTPVNGIADNPHLPLAKSISDQGTDATSKRIEDSSANQSGVSIVTLNGSNHNGSKNSLPRSHKTLFSRKSDTNSKKDSHIKSNGVPLHRLDLKNSLTEAKYHSLERDLDPKALDRYKTNQLNLNSTPVSNAAPCQMPPDLLSPIYVNQSQLSEMMSKPIGTKVAPPILPRHAHSKSLVGDVSCTLVRPRHAHSRSLVEDQLMTGGKAKLLEDGLREVTLFLGPTDRRFGFSVVGGTDEGFDPRIDEMAQGSPADKADLEVGDEILEVNGKSLEDASHTEVISHIHQCIRSRTICLRVKRRTGNKLAADLAASSNVQDAFVIAVEQRAKERLERLSALKKIKPVDISKLSSQLSDPSKSSPSSTHSPSVSSRTEKEDEVNGVFDSSSIYVTSVPNLTSANSHTEPTKPKSSPKQRSRSSTPKQTSGSPSPRHQSRGKSPSTPSPQHLERQLKRESSGSSGHHRSSSRKKSPNRPTTSQSGSDKLHKDPPVTSSDSNFDTDAGNKSGDELELTHDLDNEDTSEDLNPLNTTGDSRSEDDVDDDLTESGDSLPATPEKTYGIGSDRREVLLDSKIHHQERTPVHHTTSEDSKGSSTSSRKSGGSGSSAGANSSTKPFRGSSSRQSSERPPPTAEYDAGNMISMVEFDPSHKEMAVDVPDTFVGRTKTPPRYPPPKPRQSPIHHNNNNNSNSSKGSKKGGSSGTVTPVNGTLPKPISPPKVPQTPKPPSDVVVQSPNSQEEINRIKKYEEEIKIRREREEAVAELQRTSIRGSQKLQSLASYPQGAPVVAPSGVVNPGFNQDESLNESTDKGTSPSINELIQSLQRIQNVLKSNGHRISEDMTLVAQLLVNPEFQKVLAVHNKVQEIWCLNRPPTPHSPKSQELATECIELLNKSGSPEAIELAELLSKYTLEGLFYSHDRIADSEPLVESPESSSQELVPEVIEVNVDTRITNNYPEQNVQIVRIDKTNEPLGATIRNEGDAVIIGRIVRGGAAEKSGLLHEGDEILEVNGVEVRAKSVNDVCDMLAGMTGTLTFIIIPCSSVAPPAPAPTAAPTPSNQSLHVKAYFDYDPEEDLYIPCRELGMSFQKGDILHVINQSDPNWWQAYRDGEDDQSLAGLIPSKSFQEQREAVRQTVVGENNSKEKTKKGKLLCAKKHQKKKKKKMLYPNYNDGRNSPLPLAGLGLTITEYKVKLDPVVARPSSSSAERNFRLDLKIINCMKVNSSIKKTASSSIVGWISPSESPVAEFEAEEVLTYEPVDLYFPKNNRKRPIVLIGPPNIGRHELRQKLMEDRERFAAAVPHTSRIKRDRELDGQDYHFISRIQFEADILARKFVEHGEYEKAYYGTSLNAIRSVVNSGKICVLNLHPLSLKMLKNSDLKPYVVLIAPPSLEKLRQKKLKMDEPFKEEDLKEIIQKAREMEDQYGHYFDLVLINQDIERTYQQLICEINVLEREPQWVPASWLENSR